MIRNHLPWLLLLFLLLVVWLRIRARTGRRFRLPRFGRRPSTTIQFSVGGSSRIAEVLLPINSKAGAPLLLCFHGGLGRLQRFVRSSGLAPSGIARGYVVAFPAAPGGWVDGRPEKGDSTEDLEFVDALVEQLVTQHGVGRAQIFAVGVSNGGMFAQRLATERPHLLAGAASIVASTPAAIARQVGDGPPVPFALLCDTNDQIMPWRGGAILSSRTLGVGGQVISAEQARDLWVHRNFASDNPAKAHIPGPSGFSADIYDYPAGVDGAPVRFVAINGNGHGWPRWSGGAAAKPFDAGDVVLDFFDKVASRVTAGRNRNSFNRPGVEQRRALP